MKELIFQENKKKRKRTVSLITGEIIGTIQLPHFFPTIIYTNKIVIDGTEFYYWRGSFFGIMKHVSFKNHSLFEKKFKRIGSIGYPHPEMNFPGNHFIYRNTTYVWKYVSENSILLNGSWYTPSGTEILKVESYDNKVHFYSNLDFSKNENKLLLLFTIASFGKWNAKYLKNFQIYVNVLLITLALFFFVLILMY